MRKLFCLIGLMVVTALPALAQSDYPRWEAYGGYSYASLETGATAGRRNFHGWNAGLQGNVTSWLGLVGDFAGHYDTVTIGLVPPTADVGINSHTFMFGPRVTLPAGRFRPFGHVLVGIARGNAGLFGGTSADSSFGMAAGGGADIGLNSENTVAWRIQGDYLMNRWFAQNNNNYRLITGFVFRWGQ